MCVARDDPVGFMMIIKCIWPFLYYVSLNLKYMAYIVRHSYKNQTLLADLRKLLKCYRYATGTFIEGTARIVRESSELSCDTRRSVFDARPLATPPAVLPDIDDWALPAGA